MIEGKFYLIKRQGTKYKFYWAPYDPAPKRDFEDWGVAVVDLSWKTEDPRPLYLRKKKIFLQPWIQILRYTELVLSGEPELYLRAVTKKTPLDSISN